MDYSTVSGIAQAISSIAFLGGGAYIAISAAKRQLKGFALYKHIVKRATIFLVIMCIANIVSSYNGMMNELGWDGIQHDATGFSDVLSLFMLPFVWVIGVIAGAIVLIFYIVVIATLWIIYAIWNSKERKKQVAMQQQQPYVYVDSGNGQDGSRKQ